MKHLLTLSLFENIAEQSTYYHGSNTLFPFEKFLSNMDGTGLVSSRKKFGGFFFTSSRENSLFYSENYICKVSIKNIIVSSIESSHSPTVLKQAIADNVNLCLVSVVDGSHESDVVVVPYSNLSDITILEWIFVGEEESYFNELDNIFDPDDNDVQQYMIDDFFDMTGGGLKYALSEPIFAKYYHSKH